MKRARILTLSVLVLAVVPSSAGAVTLTYDDGTPATALQAWVDASYAPVAPGLVTVHRAYCPGPPAPGPGVSCTFGGSDVIWLRTAPYLLRSDLFHELGHRFDFNVMTHVARVAFSQAAGVPYRDVLRGSETFADAYSLCARHRTIAVPYFGGDYARTPTRHLRVCRVIRLTAIYGGIPSPLTNRPAGA